MRGPDGGSIALMAMSPWHGDPALQDRFHPSHPNDLQVMVHDGEPRRTRRTPEACWVTVAGVHGVLRMPIAPSDALPVKSGTVSWAERPVYQGTLLNQPRQLDTVRQGDTILFVHAPGIPHLLHVTANYLAERSQWVFVPCNKCGADQALDPPSIMARTRFPDMPEGSVMMSFTAFCPCGGTMMLSALES